MHHLVDPVLMWRQRLDPHRGQNSFFSHSLLSTSMRQARTINGAYLSVMPLALSSSGLRTCREYFLHVALDPLIRV